MGEQIIRQAENNFPGTTNDWLHRLEIVSIIQETKECKTFILATLDNWKPQYYAGQFITLVFFTKHGEKRRSYSISSAPELGDQLSITIKKVDNGEFSRLLISKAKIGDVLFCSGINGLFLLPLNTTDFLQYFFIAAGSGITPCFSLIKTLLGRSTANVVLIYSNKTKADSIFYRQLKELQVIYKHRFSIYFLYSDRYDINRSRLNNSLLIKLMDDFLFVPVEKAMFYICGPYDFMQMVNITLLTRIPSKNILKENFSTVPRLIIPKPSDTEPHNVKIIFENYEFNLVVQYPMSVLATAKINGIKLPYSCEAGRCGSCVATCTKGKLWMAYNEVLLEEEISTGRVLLCQAFPIDGDVEIIV